MAHCKYCFRSIPDESQYCPYCGKRAPLGKVMYNLRDLSRKVKQKIEENIPEAGAQFSNFLADLTQRTQKAKLPSFVKKDKVVGILQDLQQKLDVETDKKKVQEYTTWANIIEQSISGENCIVCLQPFDLSNKQPLEVMLCPSCHYAAHTDHFLTWVRNRPLCPICKTEVTDKDLVPGHLSLKDNELVFSSST
ncbi:MAG: hypothetical protein ACTSQE_01135 [Candidatus Heimdallarchaeaceae archaeon]